MLFYDSLGFTEKLSQVSNSSHCGSLLPCAYCGPIVPKGFPQFSCFTLSLQQELQVCCREGVSPPPQPPTFASPTSLDFFCLLLGAMLVVVVEVGILRVQL